MSNKILFVDDDMRILIGFKRRLRKEFDFHIAESAEEALRLLAAEGPFAVVISDQQMPGMKGIAFLKEVMARDPMTVRIMLTGNADRETAVASVNETGVFRYLNKPCPIEQIVEAINDALIEYNTVAAERDLLENTLAGSVKLLIDVLAVNDPRSFDAVSAVRRAGERFARHLKLRKAWSLDIAIMLSTLGEAMLPAELRAKSERAEALSEAEMALVERAPEVACKLISNIPRLDDVATAILYRDKAFDGSGFPRDAIAGTDIPYIARILHVLRALLAVSADRRPDAAAFDKLSRMQNRFDPELLRQARACFLEDASRPLTRIVTTSVDVGGLRAGDTAVDPIKTQNGDLALSAGTQLTTATVERVRQFHHVRPLAEPIRVSREVVVAEQHKGAA
ncbi:MAG: response regulator [Rhodobiaceae bacterium]|nr:response regulator [Rhodobiaceae bacterium]MCC0053757.1 response regulator [Rhodobiaceae bacterium]